MLNWYRDAPSTHRRVFWATFGGWGLEAADAQMFGLVLPTIVATLGITTGQGGLLASVTLVCTALGGWLAGVASDRFGRVRVLQITIGWYALATALAGFSSGFGALLLTRCLQGFGFGGEWAAGAVLISEFVQSSYRGRVLGAVQSGWAVGWAGALLANTVALALFPPQWAWRVVFWLGVLPALLVLIMRRRVADPPQFTQRAKGIPATRIFRPDLLRVTAFAALLGLGNHGGYYALTTFLPTYLHSVRHLTVLGSGGYLAVFIVASFLGYLASGWLADRIGRRNNIVLFSILCLVTLLGYLLLPLSNRAMLIAGAPLGFFSAGIPGGLGALFAELFPTEVRGNGQGFSYNLGRIISAAFPALVGYLAAQWGLALSIAVFAGGAYVIAIIAACFLPETRGRELPNLADFTASRTSRAN